MVIFEEISLGEGGPGCRLCGTGRTAAYRPVDEIVSDVGEAVRDWNCGLGPNIALGGADPLGHPDIVRIVDRCRSAGVERVRLDTPAGKLSDERLAASVLESGVRNLCVSLLGGTLGLHAELSGEGDALASRADGARVFLERAKESGIPVAVSVEVPVCRHNVHDLPQAVVAAAGMGAGHVLLRMVDGELEFSVAGPWVAAACDTGTVNTVWVEAEGIPFYALPGYEVHLSNAVRQFPGVKSEVCESCAAGDWCDGITPAASPQMLATLVRREDHEHLAENLRRAREGVSA